MFGRKRALPMTPQPRIDDAPLLQPVAVPRAHQRQPEQQPDQQREAQRDVQRVHDGRDRLGLIAAALGEVAGDENGQRITGHHQHHEKAVGHGEKKRERAPQPFLRQRAEQMLRAQGRQHNDGEVENLQPLERVAPFVHQRQRKERAIKRRVITPREHQRHAAREQQDAPEDDCRSGRIGISPRALAEVRAVDPPD